MHLPQHTTILTRGTLGIDLAKPGTIRDEGDISHVELGNFKLKNDSVVFRQLPNFKPIPFEKIGLYNDEDRSVE